MFHYADSLPFGLVLSGIIWAVALGFAAGNYACSLVYRLPRKEPVLEKKPFCGSCGTMLATKDLFPVFSALLLRHRCRYCGAKIPISHFWTEVLIGLLFALCFLQFGFTEDFILVATLGVLLIILACIEANEGGLLMRSLLVAVLVTGLLYRTLHDHTLFNALGGGLFAFMAGLLLWRREVRRVGHRYTLPERAQLLAAAGTAAGQTGLPLFFLLLAAFYAVAWLLARASGKPLPITIPLGFAVMLPLLFPHLL